MELPVAAGPFANETTVTCWPGPCRATAALKILLVEDNGDTLDFFSPMLLLEATIVPTASNLAAAPGVASEDKLDILISDIELPDGSGLELMWKLRSRGRVRGSPFPGLGSPTTSSRASPRDSASTLSNRSSFDSSSKPSRARHPQPSLRA